MGSRFQSLPIDSVQSRRVFMRLRGDIMLVSRDGFTKHFGRRYTGFKAIHRVAASFNPGLPDTPVVTPGALAVTRAARKASVCWRLYSACFSINERLLRLPEITLHKCPYE